ncbi:MAG: serine hydrolase, partial [Myxococcota bacterium]
MRRKPLVLVAAAVAVAALLAWVLRPRSLAEQFEDKRAHFGAIEGVLPTGVVRAGDNAWPLTPAHRDLSGTRYTLGEETFTVADFVRSGDVAGLIVVSRGVVVYEWYDAEDGASRRWISFSITKSVTSLLVGAAIADGSIGSVDDAAVQYLPELANGPYANVTIEELLRLSSGLPWREKYADPESDVSHAWNLNPPRLLRHIGRRAPRKKKFHYNTGEVNLLGELLRAAVGESLPSYLGRKIWRPFGMATDATWVLDEPDGKALGGCCLSATLQDYARIGLFALREGRLRDDTSTLPDGWIAASRRGKRYGRLWWLRGEAFAAIGIYGQPPLAQREQTDPRVVLQRRAEAAAAERFAVRFV